MINARLILLKIHLLLNSIIARVLGLVELFLFLRLALKFLGASPNALIVGMIYRYSDILILPFKSIFSDIYWSGRLLEIATVSAMLGYAVAVFVIFQLLEIIFRD